MIVKEKALDRKLMRHAFVMSGLTILAQAIIIALLLYLGSKGSLTAGNFALIFMLTVTVLDQAWFFTQNLFKVAEQVGVFNQSLNFISTKHEIVDLENAASLHVKTGTIVFSRVKFFIPRNNNYLKIKRLLYTVERK